MLIEIEAIRFGKESGGGSSGSGLVWSDSATSLTKEDAIQLLGELEFLNWTNYLFHFLSAELYFFTLCLKQNIYFSLCVEIFTGADSRIERVGGTGDSEASF